MSDARRVPAARHQNLLAVAGAVFAVLALAACSGTAVLPLHATDSVDRSLDIPAGTPVRVETFNGAIEVATAAGPTVTAQVRRTGEGPTQAEAEADRDRIAVTFELVDGTAVLRAIYTPSPDSISGGRGASVTLRVPQATAVELVSSNGAVSVRDTTAPVRVRTSNGAVDLKGVVGDVAVETSNGAVTVESAGATADLRTSNGALTFHGALASGAHRFETSNGSIDLTLPADATFGIDASSTNAKLTSEFTVDGTTSKDTLRGTVGGSSPATSITVRTSNANVTIHKS